MKPIPCKRTRIETLRRRALFDHRLSTAGLPFRCFVAGFDFWREKCINMDTGCLHHAALSVYHLKDKDTHQQINRRVFSFLINYNTLIMSCFKLLGHQGT